MAQKLFIISLFAILFSALAEDSSTELYPPRRKINDFSYITSEMLDEINRIPENASCRKTSLDGEWKIGGVSCSPEPFPDSADLDKSFMASEFDDNGWKEISVPSDFYRTFPELRKHPYAKVWYRRKFNLTEKKGHRRFLLNFGAVGYEMLLFVNGKLAGSHKGEFSPFELDITNFVEQGQNQIAIRVFRDTGYRWGGISSVKHAYGAQWSPECIKGGIWQSVGLVSEPEKRISKILATPHLSTRRIEFDWEIQNYDSSPVKIEFSAAIHSANKPLAGEKLCETEKKIVTLTPGANRGSFTLPAEKLKLWEIGKPNLYYLSINLYENGKLVSTKNTRFGYREFSTRNGRFYLNGKPCYLFAQNLEANKFNSEKNLAHFEKTVRNFMEVGSNIFRTMHMPIPNIFLEKADELGIMVCHEWGWCFTVQNIDFPAFEQNNLRELKEFVESSYNHPSIVMWSLGNELRCVDNPAIIRQINLQSKLVRKIDKSKRPLSAFSGCGWMYSNSKLDTDILVDHSYAAYSCAWTLIPKVHKDIEDYQKKIYGTNGKIDEPWMSWENTGFSWNNYSDPKFRVGNVDDYSAYIKKQFSWGKPDGTGYIGMAPLQEVLAPEFRERAVSRFGTYTSEFFRLNPRYAGFAMSWLGQAKASTLWTQSIFISLTSNHLFPHNLFSGEKSLWTFTRINDGEKSLLAPKLELVFADLQGKVLSREKIGQSELPAFSRDSQQFILNVPMLSCGQYRLHINVYENEERVSQNFYTVNIASREKLQNKIQQSRKIYILDTKADKNIYALEQLLQSFELKYSIIKTPAEAESQSLLIIPPECAEPQIIDFRQNPEFLNFMHSRGGILLVMEQKNPESKFLYGLQLFEFGNNFIDTVIPDHPLFLNMNSNQFDSWNNPDYGYITTHTLIPYIRNAIGVKGVHLLESKNKFGSAVIEGIEGKGRYLHTQLTEMKCYRVDSAAYTYARNLLNYAAGTHHLWEGAQVMEPSSEKEYVADTDALIQIDLRKCVNTTFSDQIPGDKQGGWTDQGRSNDFSMMPQGKQHVAGIDFEIISPENNSGKACIGLKSPHAPHYPDAVKGIELGNKLFGRLFFMHTAAWVSGKQNIGAYRVNYTDGSTCDIPLITEYNVGDWYRPSTMLEAKVGIERKNKKDVPVCTFVMEWVNPYPEKAIKSIDVLSEKLLHQNMQWAIEKNASDPLFLCIAITGDTITSKRTVVAGDKIKGTSTHGTRFPVVRAKAVDGGDILKMTFPKTSAEKTASLRISCSLSDIEPDCRYLVCRIKSNRDTVFSVLLHNKNDWKKICQGEIRLIGDNKFHTYRLRINGDMKKSEAFSLKNLHDEIFFCHRPVNVWEKENLQDVDLEIQSVVLE